MSSDATIREMREWLGTAEDQLHALLLAREIADPAERSRALTGTLWELLSLTEHARWIGASIRVAVNGDDEDLTRAVAAARANHVTVRSARLCCTNVTDEALALIEPLTDLEHLDLSETRTTDKGLARLRKLTALRKLVLDTSSITDAGLVHIAPLVELTSLWLAETDITGSGFAHLGSLARLQLLDLSSTPFGDASLEHLKPLGALSIVCCRQSEITDEGIGAFRRERPEVRFVK